MNTTDSRTIIHLPRIITMVLSFALAMNGHAEQQNRWAEVQGGTWQVSAAILKQMQSGIVPFVETDNDASSESSRKRIEELHKIWPTYAVQYQGRKERGVDIVFINAMCHVGTGFSLKTHFFRIHDGGSCYFSLRYDPKKKKFFDLWINGEA